MVQQHGRKWSHAANVAASLLAATRYVQARGGAPDNGVGAQLEALHRQCLQQARQQGKFDIAERADEYLDWEQVQRVRVAGRSGAGTRRRSYGRPDPQARKGRHGAAPPRRPASRPSWRCTHPQARRIP
eukprot:6263810-Prymnesium_polylepis.1